MWSAFWIRSGALLGGLAVAAGAFGAHDMKGNDSISADQLAVFEVAVRYQMYHALALVALGLLTRSCACPGTIVAGWSFLLGTMVFSGMLYALVFTGHRWLGAIVPVGGVLLIVGWLSLAWNSCVGAGQDMSGKRL
jgi:uncharacterized membrane protein YgdD (TMEM256/DUF423 family)